MCKHMCIFEIFSNMLYNIWEVFQNIIFWIFDTKNGAWSIWNNFYDFFSWWVLLSPTPVVSFPPVVTRFLAPENETTGKRLDNNSNDMLLFPELLILFFFGNKFGWLLNSVNFTCVVFIFTFLIQEECLRSLISSTCFNFTIESETSGISPISFSCFNHPPVVTFPPVLTGFQGPEMTQLTVKTV